MGQDGCYRKWLQTARGDGFHLPVAVRLPYPLDMGNDVWIVAIPTLLGAALGGAISFVLSRQQWKGEELRERHRRSDDRRFQAYAEFLIRERSYRNAVEAYYLHPDNRPSINELNVLLHAAQDASTLVFLVVESEDTYKGCISVMRILSRARAIIHGIESSSADDPWPELEIEFRRATHKFQNAARNELEVSGSTSQWAASAERSHPDMRGAELKGSDPNQDGLLGMDG